MKSQTPQAPTQGTAKSQAPAYPYYGKPLMVSNAAMHDAYRPVPSQRPPMRDRMASPGQLIAALRGA